jgi:hypothetical protein
MSWSMKDVEVRLIVRDGDKARVGQAYETPLLECDPCAWGSRRFVVEHPAGKVTHAWYEVITPLDNARDRFIKWSHANRVMEAQRKLDEAQKHYRDLTR